MFAFLIPIRLWAKANPRALSALLIALAVIAVLAFVYVKGRSDNAKLERARDAVAVAEAVKVDGHADATATAAAQTAAAKRVTAEKELVDAVSKIPDDVPDAVAVEYGCVQLRQAGVSTADLPACRPVGR